MNSLSGHRPLRRVLLSIFATVVGVVLLLSLKPHSTAAAIGAAGRSVAPAPAPSASSPAAGSGGTGSGGTGSGGTGSGGAGSGSGATGTRTVEGEAVQTRYGPVQLRVTLHSGRITAISVVQVPDGSPRDQEIAGFSVPQLTQEALAAQSAQIDTVSGATYTSEGYIQSLQSALDKAGG